MVRFDDAHRRDDEAALAFELRAARQVTVELRKAATAFSAWLLLFYARQAAPDGTLTPAQQQQLRAAADAGLAALSVDVAVRTTAAVLAATGLTIRQEKTVLAEHGIDAATLDVVHADPVLLHAGRDTARILDAAVADARHFATVAPLASASDVQVLAAKAGGTVSRVERQVRFVTNRAINQTTLEIVKAAAPEPAVPQMSEAPRSERLRLTPPGMRVVWWAERDACLACQALSGQVADPSEGVGFDEFATFGKPGSAPDVWPPGMPLMSPPRHNNCRCRLRIISANNISIPEALQREAQRTVARGWSDYDSKRQRLSAADRLLAHSALPKTVNARARADVQRGAFSTRHRPKAPELRIN